MMPVTFNTKNMFKSTEKSLNERKKANPIPILHRYGSLGVAALSRATPKDSGLTSGSWDYRVGQSGGTFSLSWTNSVKAGKTLLVMLIEFGHASRAGGFIYPVKFINKALKPVSDDLHRELLEVYS